VQTIRILLAEPLPWMGAVLAAEPDLTVVGEPHGEVDVLLQAAEADVVILREGAAAAAVAERLLDEYPGIAVLAIDRYGGQVRLHRLRPQVAELGEVTPAGLVAAIRHAATDPAS
jgi:hypothetical protein